jgi:aromatic-L-amino-acid decarboxylase
MSHGNESKPSSEIDERARELELNGEQFRSLVEQTLNYLSPYLDSVGEQPAIAGPVLERRQREMTSLYPSCFPSLGQPADFLLQSLFGSMIHEGYNPSSPGYLAFIPGGGIPESSVADLIANIVNRYLGLRRAAPQLAAIDDTVLDWFCQMVGYGPGSGGYLSPGGSIANMTAIITARHHQLGEHGHLGTIYTSEQTHHSITKAALHVGIPRGQIRLLPVDDFCRLNHQAAEAMMEADRAQGLKPFLLVSHAGTTNTGAIDRMDDGRKLADIQSLWWHVDAAYGGFFLLTDRGRQRLQGIHDADSITVDPHKGLFLPYGTGCLLVKDLVRLRAACSLRGDYMPRQAGESSERFDACDLSPEQTRDFRGLRIWLPMMLHGVDVFRANLDEKLDLAQHVYQTLIDWQSQGEPWWVSPNPELTVVAFRLSPSNTTSEDLDTMNRELLEEVHQDGSILLSPTILHGALTVRLCVLCFRTHQSHVDKALELIHQAARKVLQRHAKSISN